MTIINAITENNKILLKYLIVLDFLNMLFMIYESKNKNDSRVYIYYNCLKKVKNIILISCVIHIVGIIFISVNEIYNTGIVDVLLVSSLFIFIGTIYANYLYSNIVVYWECYIDSWRIGISYKLKRFNVVPEKIKSLKYVDDNFEIVFEDYSGEHELNIKMNNNTYEVLLAVLKNSGVKIEYEK